METYHASYRWTREELLRSLRHHYQSRLRPSIMWAVNIFSALLAGLSVAVFIIAGWEIAIASAPAIVFAIYWWLWRRKINDWWLGRGFEQRPDADMPIEWQFSAHSIQTHAPGLASSELNWKLFIKIVETPDGFLFYLHPRSFHWLPFSAFQQPEAIAKIRQFAAANGVKYVQLKD